MTPTHRILRRTRQAGVGIVTAIFLLVVMAGLAVAMVAMYTPQQASANIDLLGARAYQAARAGVEWGLFQQMRKSQCAATTTLALPAGTTLTGFTVIVTCKSIGTATLPQYALSSTACNMVDAAGGCTPSNNPEFVSRTVEVQL